MILNKGVKGDILLVPGGQRGNIKAQGDQVLNIPLTRSSKDECSTSDQTIILNQHIILINKSLSSLDQKIFMTLPPTPFFDLREFIGGRLDVF